ncbi:hypothetical protein [Streptosporangium sp. NPDC002721]|uniref:hypothetical protein n=1 Tax=Streptosporangium sp. NPDC002721 TaxID=3366188 RepID=UPI0036748E37
MSTDLASRLRAALDLLETGSLANIAIANTQLRQVLADVEAAEPELAAPLQLRPGNHSARNLYAKRTDGQDELIAVALTPGYAATIIAAVNQEVPGA